jgi:type I restriction enzyme S subunit
VLYSRLRPYLNKVFKAEVEGLASAEFLVLKSSPAIEPEYLRRRIMAVDFLDFTAGLDRGDRPRVDYEQISGFDLALPPLAEQRRIVAKLDSLTARTARARSELDHIPRLVEKYKQAILGKAFSGELLPGSHPAAMTQLSQVVSALDQGWSPKCESDASSDPSVWAVIKTTSVQAIHFLPEENKRLPKALEPRPLLQIEVGDILVTRAGPRSRVGITCLVQRSRTRLMLADKVYRLRARADIIVPAFLNLMLNAPQALELIEKMKSGISDSGLNLTQEKFLNLEVPVPPLEVQHRIITSVEAAFAWLDKVAAERARASHLAPKLDQSILAKAFRGELVPQDPNDEPASVLLERIKAASGEPKITRGGRGKRKGS